MTDIGFIAVLLAFVVSVYAAVAAVIGTREGFPELVHSARRGAYATAALLTLAVGVLAFALVTDDFGLRYVYEHTSRDMALAYKLAAVYSGNDGSLLFWAFVLVDPGRGRRLPGPPRYRPNAVRAGDYLGRDRLLHAAGLAGGKPLRAHGGPRSGLGMNPMLENIGMLIHPPTLYLGYVGLTIPFGFAVAALATGRLGNEWIARTRGWALFAWLMLGIGNVPRRPVGLRGVWAGAATGPGTRWKTPGSCRG